MIFNAPTCSLCRDLGILELSQGTLKTLAKCRCTAGKSDVNSVWQLPTIPLNGFTTAWLNAFEFRPTAEMNYDQKILWWKEKIKTAEEFWKTNPTP